MGAYSWGATQGKGPVTYQAGEGAPVKGQRGKAGFGGGGWSEDPWAEAMVACMKGKFGGKGWAAGYDVGGGDAWGADKSYPGLVQSMREIIEPVAHMEDKWSPEEIVKRMVKYVQNAADQMAKDERLGHKGNPIQAQALVEEFVETAMGMISQGCHDKAWAREANFATPLCLVAESIFKTSKLFSRMLAPMLHKYVEDSIFRFREEERIQRAIWETVESSGLPQNYFKKCSSHLAKGYDDAHITASYGQSEAASPEMGLLQDFIKGWMTEFIGRAWDVLENGVGAREEQINFVTNLFQTLAHPERSCLPHDLVASLHEHPMANWPFIAETCHQIFAEMDAEKPSKKKQKGAGKGPNMNAFTTWG